MQRRYLNPDLSIDDARVNIGGAALLPFDTAYPKCRLCARPLLLFLQFDLPGELGLPFEAGSHITVFMCPEHNEIPSFDRTSTLIGNYWESAEGHWFAMLAKPKGQERSVRGPELLMQRALRMDDVAEDEMYRIGVSGTPEWVQQPEHFICSCGSPMHFVCQISDSYKFTRQANAPEQPDSCYSDGYVLFLGNETYVFACPQQCNPRAVWITVQN
jgi:hypothetical protein